MALNRLGINDLETTLRYNCLRRFGFVQQNNSIINEIASFVVDDRVGPSRTKKPGENASNWRLQISICLKMTQTTDSSGERI